MTKFSMKLTAMLIALASVLAGVVPAQAASTTLWATTSTKWYQTATGAPQVVTNGTITAAAWLVRDTVDTVKLYTSVQTAGIWEPRQLITRNLWDWRIGFNLQMTAAGNLYLGTSTGDDPFNVYVRSASDTGFNTTPTQVDVRYFNIGDFKVGGTSSGTVVTFSATRKSDERVVPLSSYSFDEANPNDGWVTKDVKDIGQGDFSSCTRLTSFYDSCSITVEDPELRTAADGSQLLLIVAIRNSRTGNPSGMQFKTFKAHRPDATSDWVFDGSINTMTMGSRDTGYSYFMESVASMENGRFAVALVTGTSTTRYNKVNLFTGSSFASAPTSQDATYLSARKGTDTVSLVAFGSDFFVGFDNNGTHRFGKVGSLSSTAVNMNVSSSSDVKKLVVLNGQITAILVNSNTASYKKIFNGTAWTTTTKLTSVGGQSSPYEAAVAVSGTHLALITFKASGNRVKAVYAYTE